MEIDIAEIIKALQSLSKAFYDVEKAWAGDSGYEINELDSIAKCPFSMSFDELAFEVSSWVEDTSEELKKIQGISKKEKKLVFADEKERQKYDALLEKVRRCSYTADKKANDETRKEFDASIEELPAFEKTHEAMEAADDGSADEADSIKMQKPALLSGREPEPMEFNRMIVRIMLLADLEPDSPCIVKRSGGVWQMKHIDLPPAEAAEYFKGIKADDTCALMIYGRDFADASYPAVYDMMLSARLRAEYEAILSKMQDSIKLKALINFLEDNMSALSPGAAEYLASLEHPFTTVSSFVPVRLTDGEISEESEAAVIKAIEAAANMQNAQKNAVSADKHENPTQDQGTGMKGIQL